MLEKGKTYKFTSRTGVSKAFEITAVHHGWHRRFGPTLSIQTEVWDPEMGMNISETVRNRLGEYYVRCKDDPHSKRYTTYWRSA